MPRDVVVHAVHLVQHIKVQLLVLDARLVQPCTDSTLPLGIEEHDIGHRKP